MIQAHTEGGEALALRGGEVGPWRCDYVPADEWRGFPAVPLLAYRTGRLDLAGGYEAGCFTGARLVVTDDAGERFRVVVRSHDFGGALHFESDGGPLP